MTKPPFLRRLGAWFSVPWYPLAFAVYPILALLAFNAGQVEPSAGVRAILISAMAALLLFLILRLLFRQAHRAAFLALLWLLLFFSYGHVYDLLEAALPGLPLRPWLLLIWAGLFILFAWWASRPGLTFAAIAPSLNLIALTLVVMSAVQAFSGGAPRASHRLAAEKAPVQELHPPAGSLPDVYYFILDSYARDDLLRQAYGYDNQPFLKALEARGFYIAECSQSNYGRTEMSLGSSLNMQYLQELDSSFVPENIGRSHLWDVLKHSAVRYNFESLGYKTVNFANGFDWMELRDADEFLSPTPFAAGLTEFEGLFLRTTLARPLEDLGWVDADVVTARTARDRFRLVFSSLDDLARDPAPTFAYIHLISPHPPFVFGPDGSLTNPADFWNAQRRYPANLYVRGYLNQLTYLNTQMESGIDTILENSSTPPVIILQGDHGPWLQPQDKLFRIFNAYYLPGHSDRLYPGISPVNSFRLVFDEYFGGNYPLLEDRSYYSPVPNLYDFTEVAHPCEP